MNVDLAANVIEQMRAKYPENVFETADVTDLRFIADRSFDLVVDKGTSDTLSFRTSKR